MDYPEVGGNGFEMKPGYILKHQEQHYLIQRVEEVVATIPGKKWLFSPHPNPSMLLLYHRDRVAELSLVTEEQLKTMKERSGGRLVYTGVRDAMQPFGGEYGFSYNFKQEWS